MNFISVSNKQKYNSGIEKAEWPQIILIYKELTIVKSNIPFKLR